MELGGGKVRKNPPIAISGRQPARKYKTWMLEKQQNNNKTNNYNHNKHERNLHKSERHGDGTETEVRQGKVGNKNIPA